MLGYSRLPYCSDAKPLVGGCLAPLSLPQVDDHALLLAQPTADLSHPSPLQVVSLAPPANSKPLSTVTIAPQDVLSSTILCLSPALAPALHLQYQTCLRAARSSSAPPNLTPTLPRDPPSPLCCPPSTGTLLLLAPGSPLVYLRALALCPCPYPCLYPYLYPCLGPYPCPCTCAGTSSSISSMRGAYSPGSVNLGKGCC